MPSIKASEDGVERVEQARIEKGWTSDDPKWLVEASKILEPSKEWLAGGPYAYGCSEASLKRFRAGKPIKSNTFKAFCSALGLPWQQIRETAKTGALDQKPVSIGTNCFSNPSKKERNEVGSAHIGSVSLSDGETAPVVLDVNEVASNHVTILANNRDDKLQIARILIEELLLPKNRAAVLIFDSHAEYGTLTEIRGHTAFTVSDGYTPRVKILTPDDVRIRISSLDYYDILSVLPEMSDRQEYVLRKAFDLVRRHRQGAYRWSIQDLMVAVREVDSQETEDGDIKLGTSAPVLEWKLDRLDQSPYFHFFEHLAPKDLFEPGQVTVLQMNEIGLDNHQLICAAVLRQTIQARVNTLNKLIEPGDESHLPYPVFILLGETYRFAQANEPSRCKAVMRFILSEGRKYGVSLGLISQSPSKLDLNLLYQCKNQLIGCIFSPVDLRALKPFTQLIEPKAYRNLALIPKNQVFVSGSCIENPICCNLRQTIVSYAEHTLNASELWIQHFSQEYNPESSSDNKHC